MAFNLNFGHLQSLLTENVAVVQDTIRNVFEERPKFVYLSVGVATYVIFSRTIGVHIKRKLFAWYFDKVFTKKKDAIYETYKEVILGKIIEVESHIPELKAKKAVKILEIGVGSGANFSYYPDGSHLIAVDPNPYFSKYYNENRAKFPNITSEEIFNCSGEEITLPGSSVDVVVITLVLCSVQDVERILQHVHRVLVPGGKFFFMEHVKEWDTKKHGARGFFQEFFTKTGIWPFFFDGCLLNRNFLPILERQGFTDISCEKIYAEFPMELYGICAPHLRGIATK